jgi:sulfate adenylyltransferase (ADP) / ATP adenylyltransferase
MITAEFTECRGGGFIHARRFVAYVHRSRVDQDRVLAVETLWPQLQACRRRALESGALVPLETSVHVVDDDGVPFIIRIPENLPRKQQAGESPPMGTPDPFSPPYEPDLYVSDVSPSHVALLNKFSVLDHHFLLVTREYAEQPEHLTKADFEAMLLALGGVNGLAFYNSGPEAGASQPHKHMQVVPLPLVPPPMMPDTPSIPLLPIIERAGLPFAHAVTPMPGRWREAPAQAAAVHGDTASGRAAPGCRRARGAAVRP